MKIIFFLAASLLTIIISPAYCHDLQHTVTQGDAVVVNLFFTDNTKFSYESYEIFRPDEKIPFQIGRTDAQGRVVFVPDRRGAWRIKVFSEDGHGLEITVEINDRNILIDANKSLFDRYSRILVGIAFIFGLFGLCSLLIRRKKT